VSRLLKYLQKAVGEFVAEAIVLVIGWLICVSVLAGAFALGRWAVPYFGWGGNPDTFGLLSALACLWLYEHRHFEGRLDRLWEAVTRQI